MPDTMTAPRWTRKQRLADECSHREYFAQFVDASAIASVVRHIHARKLIASTDPHFNDIPLKVWDILPAPFGTAAKMKALGDFLTLAGQVCIHKEAARQYVEAQAA